MNVEVSRVDRGVADTVAGMNLLPGMFEPINRTQREKTPRVAMIVCTICKHLAYSPVNEIESEILLDGGLISRHCQRCGAATSWLHFDWHRPNWDSPLLYQTAQPDRV